MRAGLPVMDLVPLPAPRLLEKIRPACRRRWQNFYRIIVSNRCFWWAQENPPKREQFFSLPFMEFAACFLWVRDGDGHFRDDGAKGAATPLTHL